MLYRPTNAYPCSTVVDASGSINFCCSCQNEPTGARLIFTDSHNEQYYRIFRKQEQLPFFEDGEISVIVDCSDGEDVENLDAVSWHINSIHERSIDGWWNIRGLITNGNDYTWRIRLYQTMNDVNIGYGFVQEIVNPSPFNSDKMQVKIRPHTDMFYFRTHHSIDNTNDNINDGTVTTLYNNSTITGNDITIPKNLLVYQDPNITYSIGLHGQRYEIGDYYYAKKMTDTSKSPSLIGSTEAQLDSYGNPLCAYIEVDKNANIEVGDQYSIYTNYIDSLEYPFGCRATATVTFASDLDGSAILFDDGQNGSSEFNLSYANFSVTGNYTSANNTASANHTRFLLYEVDESGVNTIVDDTGEVCTSAIHYEYSDFFAKKRYRLVAFITDTDGIQIVKSLNIVPSFTTTVLPQNMALTYYKEHGSVVVDMSDMIPVSGQETYSGGRKHYYLHASVPASKAYDVANWTIEVDDAPPAPYDLLDSVRKETYACQIGNRNTITYDTTSGLQPMTCSMPLFSMVFRTTVGAVHSVFELVDDDGYRYNLNWNNDEFNYTFRNRAMQYLGSWQYTFDPDIQFVKDRKSKNLWWQVILTRSQIYIRCLNGTLDEDENDIILDHNNTIAAW